MFRKTLLASMLGCATIVLTGCTDDSDDDHNENPVIILASEVAVAEKALLVIEADVVDDGQVSYEWQQLSGPTLSLQGDLSSSLGISAPAVTQPEQAILQLTVTDAEGLSDTAQVVVKITQNLLILPIKGRIFTGLETQGEPGDDGDIKPPVEEAIVLEHWAFNEGVSEKVPVTALSTFDTVINTQTQSADLEYNDFQVKAYLGGRDSAELASTVVLPDGTYSLSIEIDDDEAMVLSSEPFLLEATFANGKGVMQSQLLSFGDLYARVQTAEVSSVDYLPFNISPFSTVHRALLARGNQYQPIDSDANARLLQLQLNMNDLANYTSAYTSLLNYGIVENNPGINLPSQYTNSLAFLQDDFAFNQYKNTTWWEPNKFEYTTQLSFEGDLNTDQVILSFSNGLGVYANFDLIAGEIHSASLGRSFTNSTDTVAQFNWRADEQSYFFSNEEGMFHGSGTQTIVNDNGEEVEVTINQYISDISIKLLQQVGDSTLVHFSATRHTAFPNEEREGFSESISWYSDAYDSSFFSPTKPSIGSTWALPTPRLDYNLNHVLNAGKFEFTGDAVGVLHAQGLADESMAFDWSYSANEILEIHVPALQARLSYDAISGELPVKSYHVMSTNTETSERDFSVDFAHEVTDEQSFTEENVAGIYAYVGDASSLNEFWLEFHENGDAYRVEASDSNTDGMLTEAEILVHKGEWQINEGELDVLFYTDSACTDVGCPLYRGRDISLINKVDNKLYFHHTYKFNWDTDSQDWTLLWTDNRVYDLTSERPIAKQYLQSVLGSKLPYRTPGAKIEGLLPISTYLDKPLYHVDHDYWYEQETGFLQLNSDATYTRFSHGETVTEQYQIDKSNQILLTQSNTTSGYYSYGFLAESDNVVLGAFIGLPWPHFYKEQSAKDYAKRVFDMEHTKSFSDYYGQPIFMADRDSSAEWQVTPLMMTESDITVYVDKEMTQVAQVFAKDVEGEDGYTVTDDGRILFNDGNSLYIPLATSGFASVVTDVAKHASKDFNYFFFSVEQADTFVYAVNELRRITD